MKTRIRKNRPKQNRRNHSEGGWRDSERRGSGRVSDRDGLRIGSECAGCRTASAKTYAAKGRPSDNPLIVHIAEYGALEKIVKEIPPKTETLANAFWPGPLTMIFEKSEIVPYETTGGLETVAVRMPSNLIAMELIRAGRWICLSTQCEYIGKTKSDEGGACSR